MGSSIRVGTLLGWEGWEEHPDKGLGYYQGVFVRVWVECLMRLFYKSGVSYSGGGGLRTIEDWVL